MFSAEDLAWEEVIGEDFVMTGTLRIDDPQLSREINVLDFDELVSALAQEGKYTSHTWEVEVLTTPEGAILNRSTLVLVEITESGQEQSRTAMDVGLQELRHAAGKLREQVAAWEAENPRPI